MKLTKPPYRLVCSYTTSSALYRKISRFRLFRRESGTSSFVNCLPALITANQDGYEVSTNSEYDSGLTHSMKVTTSNGAHGMEVTEKMYFYIQINYFSIQKYF
jgi:hypothetical protein